MSLFITFEIPLNTYRLDFYFSSQYNNIKYNNIIMCSRRKNRKREIQDYFFEANWY